MKFIVLDLETTGLNVRTCRILGIALCVKAGEAFYITFSDSDAYNSLIIHQLKLILEDPTIEKIGHNLKFDIQVLKQYGINVNGRIHDTMVADYILYPNRKKHGLKLITLLHLNYRQIEFDDIAITTDSKIKTLIGVDPKIVTKYACEDVDYTFRLHKHISPKIANNNLSRSYDMDCNLVYVLADMEYTGICIDHDKLLQIEDELTKKQNALQAEILGYCDDTINLNSQHQLNHLLFNILKLSPIGKKGKNRLYSLSGKNLMRMKSQHPVIPKIIEYKGVSKVLATFIPSLKNVNPTTNRIHTSINQTVTETGRLSSSNPNLQNIPSRTIGNILRQLIVASSANHVLIGVDYSNIELRLMAIISMDEVMVKSYRNAIDLHTLTATKIFNKEFKDVSKIERNVGKTVNFGLIYGMSAHGLSESLFKNTGVEYSLDFCKQVINDYFQLYQGVCKCREQLIYDATINGYTETLFGRKRPLPNINSSDKKLRNASKRLAMNTPVQGSAADIIKIAMINIHRIIKSQNLQSRMILQVHDELLFDVPLKEVEYMSKIIKEQMEHAVSLPIALEVELKIGNNWSEIH